MRGRSSQSGFTIIEVTLFLAISGLLFMIGFFGISNRTESVQLTDSMQSLNTKIRDVYTDVFAGVNTRQTNNLCDGVTNKLPGKAYDCALLGYVLVFSDVEDGGGNHDEVTIHSLISDQLTQEYVDDNPNVNLQLYEANIRSVAQETYKIEWGTEFVGGRVSDLSTTGDPSIYTNNIGFVRTPRGSGIVPIIYRDISEITDGLSSPNILMVGSEDIADAMYCFEGPDNERAAFNVNAQGGANITELVFDDTRCDDV